MFAFFHEGGFGMWFILAAGFGAIVLAIAYALTGERQLRLPAAGVALGTLLLGALFWWHGLNLVADALAAVDPAMHDVLEEAGRREAARNIQLGGGLFVVAAIAFGAGELGQRARNSR